RYCKENNLPIHPARFPAPIPEYFIRFLTDRDDLVLDPFAGSCVTGEVSERLQRRWICAEIEEKYLLGAKGRFLENSEPKQLRLSPGKVETYRIQRPGALWDDMPQKPLPKDGGRKRTTRRK
ncbi:MAG: site-specific DNA-methyltransferase, partial [Chloroflexi bacterium]|nr:site-specific DNA-methyltransferase [Chloroflexota bacterium]